MIPKNGMRISCLAVALTVFYSFACDPDIRAIERQIRGILEVSAADWNRGDLEAFCAGYSEDATFITPNGVTRGRAEILARYNKRYREDGKAMGHLLLEPLDVRVGPSARSASVGLRWQLSWPDKPVAKGYSVVVMHRRGSDWLIVQDASM